MLPDQDERQVCIKDIMLVHVDGILILQAFIVYYSPLFSFVKQAQAL